MKIASGKRGGLTVPHRLLFAAFGVLVLLFCTFACREKVYAKETQEKMPRIEFLRRVVAAVEEVEAGESKSIDTDKEALKASNPATGAKSKNTESSLTDAEVIAEAKRLGLITDATFKDYSYMITRLAAVKILVKADEHLYGKTIDDKTVKLVMNERISDIAQIEKEADKKSFAKGYALGFVCGKSDGNYTETRTCTPMSKPYASTLIDMVEMLKDKSLRYRFSPYMQMLRVSKKNRPITEDKYPYILDSFPNEYYDTAFGGMDVLEGTAVYFHKTVPYMSLEERASVLAANGKKNKWRFIWPYELEDFASLKGDEKYQPAYMRKVDKSFTDEALEYYKVALNVDYRTVREDKEWQKKVLKYLSQAQLDEYIETCEKNQTILECDFVACDPGATYYYDGFRGKIYAHVRAISDKGIEQGDPFETAEYSWLIPSFGEYCFYGWGDRDPFVFIQDNYKMGEWINGFFSPYGEYPTYYDKKIGKRVPVEGEKVKLSTIELSTAIMEDHLGIYPNLKQSVNQAVY